MIRGDKIRFRRGVIWAALASTAALLSMPTACLAEGGKSIASAPPVVYGQQEIGNTATGQYLEDSCGFSIGGYRSYWSLGVLAGDKVTINWEGTPGTRLDLMPVGTTDYTLFQTNPALYQDLIQQPQEPSAVHRAS